MNELYLPVLELDLGQYDQFYHLTKMAALICECLAEEGIKAASLKAKDQESLRLRFETRPRDWQKNKVENFVKFYELCREVALNRGRLSDQRNSLKAFLYRNKLEIPDHDDVMSSIDEDTYIEVYDTQFTQIFRSLNFLSATNHSLVALETCEWFELFKRSRDLTSDQIEVVSKIFDGSIRVPVFKPIDDHSVSEVNSDRPRISQAEILLYAPIFGSDKSTVGILHLFKVYESRALALRLVGPGEALGEGPQGE